MEAVRVGISRVSFFLDQGVYEFKNCYSKFNSKSCQLIKIGWHLWLGSLAWEPRGLFTFRIHFNKICSFLPPQLRGNRALGCPNAR
jgi:hypothetical protein